MSTQCFVGNLPAGRRVVNPVVMLVVASVYIVIFEDEIATPYPGDISK